jgi:hypothetical protein
MPRSNIVDFDADRGFSLLSIKHKKYQNTVSLEARSQVIIFIWHHE